MYINSGISVISGITLQRLHLVCLWRGFVLCDALGRLFRCSCQHFQITYKSRDTALQLNSAYYVIMGSLPRTVSTYFTILNRFRVLSSQSLTNY